MAREIQASDSLLTLTPIDPHKAGRMQVRFRLAVLSGLLIALSALGWSLYGEKAHIWWLGRQPLDALRSHAIASNSDARTRYEYAQRLLHAGDTTSALTMYQRAYEALPGEDKSPLAAQIVAHVGYLLARQGDAQEADVWLSRAHKLNDEDALTAVGYGILFTLRGKYDYAGNQFRYATELDGSNVEAWFRLGETLTEDGKARLAIEPLRRAARLAPNDAAIHSSLGHALALQSRFPESIAEFRKAAALDSATINYKILLGSALAQNAQTPADYQEAITLLEAGHRAYPSDANLDFTIGELHLRFNALPQARVHLLQCVQRLPGREEAWYNLARLEQRLGHSGEAAAAQARFKSLHDLSNQVSVAEKHAANSPGDLPARLVLAPLYRQQGKLEAARAQYGIAVGLNPGHPKAKRAFEELSRQIAALHTRADAPTSLGPPPPPGLQVYDPNHELPAFRPETNANTGTSAALPTLDESK